jgi:tRNA1(Val) A37 N6-methylase TrmN6
MDDKAGDSTDVDVSDDGLLGGRLQVLQPALGYRAGLDAVMLGTAVAAVLRERADAEGNALELGCGAGAALLIAAHHARANHFLGIERDPAAAALAGRNVSRNGMQDRVDIKIGDAARRGLGRPAKGGGWDCVFANPPFFDDPGAIRGPSAGKRAAWIAETGLGAWVDAALAAVREGGHVVLIHRADRLGDLLGAIGRRAGDIRVLPLWPRAGAEASRVLLRARKSSRAPLRLLPGLILHQAEGAPGSRGPVWTEAAAAILEGRALPDWG